MNEALRAEVAKVTSHTHLEALFAKAEAKTDVLEDRYCLEKPMFELARRY